MKKIQIGRVSRGKFVEFSELTNNFTGFHMLPKQVLYQAEPRAVVSFPQEITFELNDLQHLSAQEGRFHRSALNFKLRQSWTRLDRLGRGKFGKCRLIDRGDLFPYLSAIFLDSEAISASPFRIAKSEKNVNRLHDFRGRTIGANSLKVKAFTLGGAA